jgi:magnesium transporter
MPELMPDQKLPDSMNDAEDEDLESPEEQDEEQESGWIADQLEDVTRRNLPGSVPGHITSDPDAMPVRIRVIQYDVDQLQEISITDPQQIRQYVDQPAVTWVNVDGLRDTEQIAEIGHIFGIHRLVLEDIVHPHQRAKAEFYGDQMFLVARMPEMDGTFDTEQISIVVFPNAVVTFQERRGDCLEPVRHRIREGLGRIRQLGHDYLVYALLDAIVDAYFPVLGRIREKLDLVERQLTEEPSVDVVTILQRIRTLLFVIRGTIGPHQDVVSHLLREPTHMSDDTKIHLRDCADHIHQALDACETTRELTADLRDYCFAEISFNQNETMKTLTVMASVFIPLSFVAGVYGMNFDPDVSAWNMPETRWPFGYVFAIGVMATVSAITLGSLYWMSRSRKNARKERFIKSQRILD